MIRSPYETSVTRAHIDTGKRVAPSTANRKPYRTAAQRKVARSRATIHNGTHISSAPVSFHD